MFHNLDFVIGTARDNLPQPRFIGKTPDLLDFKIGKMIHHLDLIIGKTTYKLNASMDFGEIDILTCHIRFDIGYPIFIQVFVHMNSNVASKPRIMPLPH